MTRRAAFTQADVAKVLKGARQAGAQVTRIEIEPGGRIVALIGAPDQSEGDADEWSRRIHAKREQRAAGQRH